MKKALLFTAFALILAGCSHSVEYNRNAEVAPVDDTIAIERALQGAIIYVSADKFKNEKFKASTKLGNDDSITINLGEFVAGETKRFFDNYLTNLSVLKDQNALNSNGLLILPNISSFSYGFYSADGFDVTAKPYVSYDLNLKIFKNQKLLYNKNISTNERNFGESAFYGGGEAHHAQIAPILQKAISNDLNVHASEIIAAINSVQ